MARFKRPDFSALGQILSINSFVGGLMWKINKWMFSGVMILNILYSAIIIPSLYLDKKFFDVLVSNITNPSPQESFQVIIWLVVGRLILQLIRNLFRRLSGYWARLLIIRTGSEVEIMIASKYASISVPDLENPDFKDRYMRIERESGGRIRQVADQVLQFPTYLSGVVSSLSVFIVGQPLVIILSLTSLIPSLIVERIFIKKDFELEDKVSGLHRIRGMYSYFLGRTRAYMDLRLLGMKDYLKSKIYQAWNKIISLRSDLMRKSRTWSYIAGIVDDVVSYAFDGYFAFMVIVGKSTIGSAQAYIRAIANFKQNVSNLTTTCLELYENFLYLSDVMWLLKMEEPYNQDKGRAFNGKISKLIEFKDVWFKYPNTDNWILKGVSFSVKAHDNVAIVGNNGAGKTTLVKLLCGFYKPDKGSVTVDGLETFKIKKPQYWKALSVLFQDFEGYNVTVGESIAAGDISRSEDKERIRQFAKKVDIDSWITSLPLGYDNPLSRDFPKGIMASTGQWQRIGIARALFRDPQMLILDEPTSNVDPEAEEEIFDNILTMGKNKTIFFISHRFSTVRRADKIIVMDDGKVIEHGTHDTLIEESGKYAHMFNLQAKSYQ